jgi:hypothetical protein
MRRPHQVGVTGGMCGAATPTWNAIELSSLVAFATRLEVGELNSWHSASPLVRDEGLQNGLRHRGRKTWFRGAAT